MVKPAIGAGSIDTRRFTDRTAAREHAAALQASGRTALVQPYDARVEAGETALVFLGGEQSHAFTKGPMLPPEGELPELDESGTFAAESLRAPTRISPCGTWATPRWTRPRGTWESPAEICCTPAST